MRVVDLEEMKEIERLSYKEFHLSESLIIENVGLRGADFIQNKFLSKSPFGEIVVLVGPGNNGADGLAIARYLKNKGHGVRAFILFPGNIKKNCELEKQLNLARVFGVKITEVKEMEQLSSYFTQTQEKFLVIDGILGTGTRLPLSQLLFEIINEVNSHATMVVSLDIPSGVTGDLGEVSSVAINANYTLCIGLPKTGVYISQGLRHSGKVCVLEVGFPRKVLQGGDKKLLSSREVASSLKLRNPFDHKNKFGHLLAIGGSRGLTGALTLASSAALRVGAGLVSAITWEDNYLEFLTRLGPDIMTGVIPKKENLKNIESVLRDMEKFSAIVLGPGLGKSKDAGEIVQEVVNFYKGPLILDADSLKLLNLKRDGEALSKRKGITLLTPHIGEFAEFAGISRESLLSNPLEHLREVIDATNCFFILKGSCSYIGTPSGEFVINSFPNDGMAKGGSGDVLAGILGGVFAQVQPFLKNIQQSSSLMPRYFNAINLGLCLHTLAGKYASLKFGNYSMTASSIIEHIPDAFRELEGYWEGH